MKHVPYGHHDPRGKTLRQSVVELASEGYTIDAIASELGLTASGKRKAARWINASEGAA